jgi:hypothetical protein
MPKFEVVVKSTTVYTIHAEDSAEATTSTIEGRAQDTRRGHTKITVYEVADPGPFDGAINAAKLMETQSPQVRHAPTRECGMQGWHEDCSIYPEVRTQ